MKRSGSQLKLFETEARLAGGFLYRPDFITPDEEELLIAFVAALPLVHARGGEAGEYAAKRRHRNFGWSYDFKNERLIPGPPLPPFLGRFARRIEKWLDLPKGRVVEALVNEYPVGGALGWHRDNEPFAHVVGISLAGWVKMRLRPIRPAQRDVDRTSEGRFRLRSAQEVVGIELEPRSAYVLQGDVRWKYQHSIAASRALRYSITFRTLPEGMPTPRQRRGAPAVTAASRGRS